MPISYRAAQTLIRRGDEEGLTKALDEGLDPNLTNENGWSLLMLAAVEGAVPLGKILLGKGASNEPKNSKNETALDIACNRGFGLFVELLADPSTPPA